MVDRNGMINIPRVRSISVAGIAYKDITKFVKTAVSRNFRNFDLPVTMGQLRSRLPARLVALARPQDSLPHGRRGAIAREGALAMRYLVLAGLMFALGLVVVSLDAREHTYIPVVRLRTADGFFITAVQARTHDRKKCVEATDRFLGQIMRQCQIGRAHV